MEKNIECCKLGCNQEAKFFILAADDPYADCYACGDHVQELKGDGERVFRLSNNSEIVNKD